jgi:hypothetical protein
MEFNLDRVRANIRGSSTEDLLDRITVYRGGMEPEAIQLIERELRDRGVTAQAIERHAEERFRQGVPDDEEAARMCSFCRRPAVAERIGWHKLWGLVPLFPRLYRYCYHHLHGTPEDSDNP